MSAKLVFSFDPNVTADQALADVAAHFGITADQALAAIPAYIKQAVETVGAQILAQDNPAHGVDTSAAMAFAGLVNGTGNGAPLSADAGTSTIVHAANSAISQISLPVTLAPAPPNVGAAQLAHVASAEQANPVVNVEFDSTGLPWDERIHSGNKTKTEKGEWRGKKGADKSLIKSIEAELRAKYPGNGANGAAVTNAQDVTGSNINAVASADPNAKRVAALEYAHNEATRVAGNSPIEAAVLNDLLNGKQHTLTPQQADWFSIYYAKRNAAFTEYMAGNVAAAVQPSLTPIGNTPVVQPVQHVPDSSQVTAVTQVPVQTVQHSELDAAGLPHDTRINVGAKIKDAAGVWVQRHDVAPAVRLQVIAELRAALAGNGAANASNTAPVGASSPVAAPGVTAEEAKTAFPKLMQWIVANQTAGNIKPSDANECAASLGFVDAQTGAGVISQLMNQPTFVPYMVDLLISKGAK